MKRLLSSVGALALLGIGAQATAATVDLGEISAGSSVGGSLFYSEPGVEIQDSWVFTITEALRAAVVVDSADLGAFFGIDDLVVESAAALMSFDYSETDNSYSFTGLLPAGTYTIDINGMTGGMLGGQYQVLVGALGGQVPVPVPVPLALLASGMLTLGLMRRRKANEAA